MRKFLVAVAALALAGTVAGCGEESIFTREYNAWGTGSFPVANDGQAALYIVREAGPAGETPIEITIGRQSLVNLAGPNYVRLDLDPRLYDLRAYGPQKNKELVVTVAPGQTRFLLAQLTPDGGAQLLELSQEQGRRLVRRGERVYTPAID